MEVMKKLVQDIVAAEYALQEFVEDEPMRPVPGGPASVKDLAVLEAHLRKAGLPFPPSYRKFLGICDGIQGFMSYFSLLSIEGVMQGPTASQRKRYPELARFVVGRGDSLEFLAFDADASRGDELEVVFVADDGEESRYSDFRQFLNEHLGALNDELAAERGDRKGLKK